MIDSQVIELHTWLLDDVLLHLGHVVIQPLLLEEDIGYQTETSIGDTCLPAGAAGVAGVTHKQTDIIITQVSCSVSLVSGCST